MEIPLMHDGTPLYRLVEVNGRKYCDHRVFGLIDGQWLNDHGVKASDDSIPSKTITNDKGRTKAVPNDQFMEGERKYRDRNNPYYQQDKEAMDALVGSVKEIGI